MAGASALLALGLALRLRPAAFVGPAAEASLRDMLTRAIYLRMMAILSLTGAGFGVVVTFVAPFALSLGLSQVRGFFVAFACSAVVMRLFVLRGLTRYGERSVARASLFFYGLSVLAAGYLGADTLALLGAFLGLAHGVFMPVFTALMLREAPLHECIDLGWHIGDQCSDRDRMTREQRRDPERHRDERDHRGEQLPAQPAHTSL